MLADLHVGDLDFGKLLPVPRLAAVVAPALELEHVDLFTLAVPDDLGGDLGALDHRRPGIGLLAITGQEHLFERHLGPGLTVEERDLQRDALFGAELLASGLENRVTHRAGILTGSGTWVNPEARPPKANRRVFSAPQ